MSPTPPDEAPHVILSRFHTPEAYGSVKVRHTRKGKAREGHSADAHILNLVADFNVQVGGMSKPISPRAKPQWSTWRTPLQYRPFEDRVVVLPPSRSHSIKGRIGPRRPNLNF